MYKYQPEGLMPPSVKIYVHMYKLQQKRRLPICLTSQLHPSVTPSKCPKYKVTKKAPTKGSAHMNTAGSKQAKT